MPSRIELIPIEWYDQLHSSSSALTKSLNSVTLPTIAALRELANQAVFDVLLYLSPGFCEPVLESVTTQINTIYAKYLEMNPNFLTGGGKFSLIGHSLGSVICWDLLSILKDSTEPRKDHGGALGGKESTGAGVTIISDSNSTNVGYQAYAKEENADTAKNGTWGPSLPKPMQQVIHFKPECTCFLGSPLGLFLTLRGAHPVFDDLRKKEVEVVLKSFEEKKKSSASAESNQKDENADEDSPVLPFASPFTLPSEAIYNIINVSDPVAYRIEPLLLPPDMDPDEIPTPVHLTAEGKDVRLHVKAQQLGGEIGKLLEGKRSYLGSSFGSLFTQAVTALAKPAEDLSTARSEPHVPNTGPKRFPLGGKSARVDFQLQRGVVDSEYLSAVTAHSSYFINIDVQDFLSSLAAAADRPKTQGPEPEQVDII
jgi:phospholipase DDHD2